MKKLLNFLTIVLSAGYLFSCQGSGGFNVVQPQPSLIEQLVSIENVSRAAAGYSPIYPGLFCQTSAVVSGSSVFSYTPGAPYATFHYSGNLNYPENLLSKFTDLLPQELKNYYASTNYKIECQGYLVVTDPGYALVSLSSNDASVLYINGYTVLNNGSHPMTTVTSTVFLPRGIVNFSFTYLELSSANGSGFSIKINGAPINPNLLYRE